MHCVDRPGRIGRRRNIAVALGRDAADRLSRAVMPDGKTGIPCGACREFLMQLDASAGQIEILCGYETKKVVQLKMLIPDWWHTKTLNME